MTTFADLNTHAKRNLEAMVASVTAATKGAETLGAQAMAFSKKSVEDQVAAARQGSWSLYLSDCKPVPRDWFPSLQRLKVLCLASGGGQQAPIFAALGAEVTLLDASARQLAQDRFVAERDNLSIRLVEGDMADLSAFADASFGLIFNL